MCFRPCLRMFLTVPPISHTLMKDSGLRHVICITDLVRNPMPTLLPGSHAIPGVSPAPRGTQPVHVRPNQTLHDPRRYQNVAHPSISLGAYVDTMADLLGQGWNPPTCADTMPTPGMGGVPGTGYIPGVYVVPLYPGRGWAWLREESPLVSTS